MPCALHPGEECGRGGGAGRSVTHLSSWCSGKFGCAPAPVGTGWVGAEGPGRGRRHHSRTGTGTLNWMRWRELGSHCRRDCGWRPLCASLCSWEPRGTLYWKEEDRKLGPSVLCCTFASWLSHMPTHPLETLTNENQGAFGEQDGPVTLLASRTTNPYVQALTFHILCM